jgi:hypothetical protein
MQAVRESRIGLIVLSEDPAGITVLLCTVIPSSLLAPNWHKKALCKRSQIVLRESLDLAENLGFYVLRGRHCVA